MWLFKPETPFQLWRLFSAHFSHWSWGHWWTNVAAFSCFLLLFAQRLTLLEILSLSVALLIGNAVFLLGFYERAFYLGFSGLLYGWFFYAALQTWGEQTLLSTLVLVYLGGRIFTAYFLPSGMDTIDGLAVTKEIHGFNSLLAFFFWAWQRFLGRRTKPQKGLDPDVDSE